MNLIFKNAIWQYGFVLARYIFPFLTLPYLARVLEPDAFAGRSYIVSLMLFMLSITDFGFNLSGTRLVVKNRGNRSSVQKILSSIIFAKILLLVAVFLCILVLSQNIEIIHKYQICIYIAYISLCFNSLLPDFIFMGHESMRILTTRFVASRLVSTVLIFLFVDSPCDIELIFCFELLAAIVSFVASWSAVIKQYKYRLMFVKLNEIFVSFKEGVPYFISNISVVALNSCATIYIGIFSSNTTEISGWSIALTAINAFLALYNPLLNSLFPYMSRVSDYTIFKKYLIFGMSCATLFTTICFYFKDLIFIIIGGDDYISESYILEYLSPLLLFSFPSLIIGVPLLGARGYQQSLTITSLITAVIYIVSLNGLILLGFYSVKVLSILRCVVEAILLLLRIFAVSKNIGITKIIKG